MTRTSRLASSQADLLKMRHFVAKVQSQLGTTPAHWHVGDVSWWWFQNNFHHSNYFQLWKDAAGELQAIACLWKGSDESWLFTPCVASDGAGCEDVFAWARQQQTSAKLRPHLELQALVGDVVTPRLSAQGYRQTDSASFLLVRDLSNAIEQPTLPSGVSLTAIVGEDQFVERIALQQEEWHPITVESYRDLRGTPGYDAALDLVAAMPDGTFAAYAIAWLDEVNGIGMFDPVATRQAYRRQGLGRAVLLEACRRLQSKGAQVARVQCAAHNIAFYESAGFHVANRWQWFVRE